MDRTRRIVIIAGGVALVAMLALAARRRDPVPASPPPPPIPRRRTGAPTDRGRSPAVGLDVERLKQLQRFEPVVEYLTYLQSQRGDQDHLLFVRHADLDELAALEGMPLPSFLDRLDQLGVVVSTN